MSNSKNSFDLSIQEAESILGFYNQLNQNKLNSKELEVLKRAGLIIALTAWETYVEDRIEESVSKLLVGLSRAQVGKFMTSRLDEELKRFHNPNSEKTKKLFSDYLGIDIFNHWDWNNFDLGKIKKTLDELVSKRGEAAHRAKIQAIGNEPDLIKIEELRKSIVFLRKLVEITDKALDDNA
jgi:RiboL-PSP-HEPN